jgi:hypothetical protein
MKKLALALLILISGSTAAEAQKFTQPNVVKAVAQVRNPTLFKEKATQLTSALNTNNLIKSQSLLGDLMGMVMSRGDELVKTKAPKSESDAQYNIGRQMKGLLNDVAGNKQGIIDLVQKAVAAY